MKLIIILLLISLCSCGQINNNNEDYKIVNLYVAGCDSVFYCAKESYDRNNLISSKKDDSVFINKIISESLHNKNKILCKPFGGNCGGVGGTTLALAEIFKSKNIPFVVSKTTTIEEKYFDDVPLVEILKQFENNEPLLIEPKEEKKISENVYEKALTIIISGK